MSQELINMQYDTALAQLQSLKRNYLKILEFKEKEERFILDKPSNLAQQKQDFLKWVDEQFDYLSYMEMARNDMETKQ